MEGGHLTVVLFLVRGWAIVVRRSCFVGAVFDAGGGDIDGLLNGYGGLYGAGVVLSITTLPAHH